MKKHFSSLLSVTFQAVFRRRWATILMVAVVLVGSFGAIVLNSLAQKQTLALEDLIANYRIRCIITDARGMNQDDLPVNSRIPVLLFTDEYGDRYSQHVRDMDALSSKSLVTPAEHGINYILSLASDPALSAVDGVTIEFYPGYSEEILQTTERVCLIPEHLLEMWPDGVVSLVEDSFTYADITIAGVIHGYSADVYYVPYFMDWGTEFGAVPSPDRCAFAIRDNTRLDEAKQLFFEENVVEALLEEPMFQLPDLTNDITGLPGLIIQDETYHITKAEMEANLQLLQTLPPILLALVGCVGLLTGHLTTRSRIKEFAVMRCLGMKKSKIFRLAILEQLVLSLLGLALGLVLGLVVSGSDALVLQAVLNAVAVALIFLVGTGLSATKIAGINVMKLMKVED